MSEPYPRINERHREVGRKLITATMIAMSVTMPWTATKSRLPKRQCASCSQPFHSNVVSGEHRPAEQHRDLHAHHGDHGHQRVAERVPSYHDGFGQPAGPGRVDVPRAGSATC